MLMAYEGGAPGTEDYGKPFNIRMQSGGFLNGWASHDGFSTFDRIEDPMATNDGKWHHVAFVKAGINFYVYRDGKKVANNTTNNVGTNTLSDDNTELCVGGRKRGAEFGQNCQEPFGGSIACAKMGKSSPSDKDIIKIYNDERVFFSENVQSTLHGTSNNITALGYDESEDILHVGTSSGRSDFRGFVRINNTTTGITSAISAHDNFIVEQ